VCAVVETSETGSNRGVGTQSRATRPEISIYRMTLVIKASRHAAAGGGPSIRLWNRALYNYIHPHSNASTVTSHGTHPMATPPPVEPTPQRPQIGFISGPIYPPEGYFATHYVPPIERAIAQSHSFVLGPARGVDTVALEYLLSRGVSATRISVYLADFEDVALRHEYAAFERAGGHVVVVDGAITTADRDAAMTTNSDYDILRYMPPAEARTFYGAAYVPRITNTEKNERRRSGLPLHYNPAYERANEGRRTTEAAGEWKRLRR